MCRGVLSPLMEVHEGKSVRMWHLYRNYSKLLRMTEFKFWNKSMYILIYICTSGEL